MWGNSRHWYWHWVSASHTRCCAPLALLHSLYDVISLVHSLPSRKLQGPIIYSRAWLDFWKKSPSLVRKYTRARTHQDNVHFPNWGTVMTPTNESALIYSFLIPSGCSNHISPSTFINFLFRNFKLKVTCQLQGAQYSSELHLTFFTCAQLALLTAELYSFVVVTQYSRKYITHTCLWVVGVDLLVVKSHF